MSPRIFVFIPAFNVASFLAEAIESVLNQTYSNWELLILDDCSTDNTADVAKEYAAQDSRIQYLRNTENLGMLENWNKGISYCTLEYFAKLDGDDQWHTEMLEQALNVLESLKDVALVFTNYQNLNSHGKIIEGSQVIFPEFAKDKAFSCLPLVQQGSSKMLSYPILRQGLSLMRTSVFTELGKYKMLLSEKTQASTDTEFYFRVGSRYKLYCIDKILYYYRIHQNSISATDKIQGLSELKMYEVKTVINDYYFSKGMINKSLWRENKNETNFKYRLSMQYQSRMKKNILASLRLSIILLVCHPVQTIHHVRNKFSKE